MGARSKVQYEWVAEPIDKDDDIIDPMYSATLNEAKSWSIEDFDGAVKIKIALVRNLGNDEEGLQDRQYAYLDNFEFDGGATMPNRFMLEAL